LTDPNVATNVEEAVVYLKKILMPTDLSPYSLAAMEYASSFGLRYMSKLYLLHVVEAGQVEEGRIALKEFVEKNLSPEPRVEPVVKTGNPVVEIMRFAEQEGADIIVMATHGRAGLRHMMMGSVAERVVRLSSIPVLTVKPKPLRENILRNEDVESDLHLR
jgi:nucleotide-binding universal stress UspA family protein